MADVLDEAASEADEFKMFGRSEIWRKANLFLVRTKPEDFGEIVTNAKSINWLADFLRTQATDSRKQAREGLWLSQSEFSSAVDSLIDRLANLTKDELFALPEPLSALFLWLQHGDPSQLRLYLKIASRSHQGFISVLHLMRGWSNSSETGISHPLRESYVSAFMDAARAKSRLQYLATGRKVPHYLQVQARELLDNWEPA